MKRVLSLAMACILLFSTPVELLASQVSVVDKRNLFSQQPTGLMELEGTEVTDPELVGEEYDYDVLANTSVYSAVYLHDWDQYATNYFYNQLDEDWQAFWDALNILNTYYLDSTDTIEQYIGFVTLPEPISIEDARALMSIYIYSNPQYYYLLNGWSYYRANDGVSCRSISLKAYDAFNDGEQRQAATKEIKTAVDAMLAQVKAAPSAAEKVKLANDLICQSVSYNQDVLDWDNTITNAEEQEQFTQSVYSTFCLGTTVCAGYSDAMTMLCNAAGVDALSVTSYNHQWNKVRINGTWYNVDATWADQESSGIYYEYFFRSDAWYESDDWSHEEEDFWAGLSPVATVDVKPVSPWIAPGICPDACGTMTAPVITEENGTITISTTAEDAEIYYTTNGKDPGVAAQKALRYWGPFEVGATREIRAVAVCDTYLDSSISVRKVTPRYQIKYVLNGGTNHKSNPTNYLEGTEVVLANPEKYGYTFKGWYTDPRYVYQVTKISKNISGDITLYAKWVPNTYKITYNLDGGTNHSNNPATYNITSKTITLKDPVKKGYTFKGWYSDAKKTKQVTEIRTGSTGAKTFYAKWTQNTYNIKFYKNGATSGSTKELKNCKYSSIYKLTENGYKRTGYSFTGWNTKADGSGKSYKNKAEISKLSSTNGATVKLYAQWKKKTYTITFKANGGKKSNGKSLAPIEYKVTTSTFTLPTPVKKGYTFKGWYTDKKFKSKTKVSKIVKGSTGNKTVYAKWSPKTYTITYKNGGKHKNPEEYTIQSKTITLKKPTKKGYTFKGWYKDSKYKEKITKIKTGSTGNLKLYAKWKKK